MNGSKVEIDKELYDEIIYFLATVDDGWIDLSHDKINTSYHYYKKKAKELRKAIRDNASISS